RIPTRAIFMVTHNIEESVLLADRVVVLGRNPARIRADFAVTLPHPRDRKAAGFFEHVDHIYKVLTQPAVEHAFPDFGGFGAPAVKARTPAKPLPHARPGGIAGLLELLLDRGGADDLYHLADELVMEVDDLLPIVDAAVLLDFIHLAEGDAAITPAGRAF